MKARTIKTRLVTVIGMNRIPNVPTMALISRPKTAPAMTSPSTMELMLYGYVNRLSKVPCCFSHGTIKGPTEDEVKKRDMAMKPGKNLLMSS
jgi:hypothetical protein